MEMRSARVIKKILIKAIAYSTSYKILTYTYYLTSMTGGSNQRCKNGRVMTIKNKFV